MLQPTSESWINSKKDQGQEGSRGMTPERMKEAFDSCSTCVRESIPERDLTPLELLEPSKQHKHCIIRYPAYLQHILFMCERGKELVDEGRIEKACRWLGFVQGYLWGSSFATIDDMKTWNMPKEEEE